MTEPRFVHLRLHSEYSVTDGLVRIDPAIHKTLEMGGVALGITDLMNVFGGLRFTRMRSPPVSSPSSAATSRSRTTSSPTIPTG